MTRTGLTLITALFAASPFFLSVAQAGCIACEYVPEVVRGSQTSDQPSYAREHHYTVERERRASPARHIVRSEPAAKKDDTADREPVKLQAENENSSISVVAEARASDPAKIEPREERSEDSSIAVASTQVIATAKPPATEAAAEGPSKPVDCKKFFPSAGLTVTVPCD